MHFTSSKIGETIAEDDSTDSFQQSLSIASEPITIKLSKEKGIFTFGMTGTRLTVIITEDDEQVDDGSTPKSMNITRSNSVTDSPGQRAHSLNSESLLTTTKKKEKLHTHTQSLDNVSEYILAGSMFISIIIVYLMFI